MTEESTSYLLTSRQPGVQVPVLRGVRVEGRLDGVLFETTLRQIFRNEGDTLLEVVYTFPLPDGAVLLGFASELGGRRQVGQVVARREAESRYEAALTEGDAPVMLEALGHGLHSANIGNLQPGEDIVLEVRFAQLVAFEQGRLRLAFPTTLAPRYGNPLAAGLQPQQVPEVSLFADYPLSLSLTVGGALAGAAISCPTHACTQTIVEGGRRLELATGAALDRDVVMLVQPREPQPSLVVHAADDFSATAATVVLAALQPRCAARPRQAIAVKLLVDCSGSMAGDSIESARRALRGVLDELGDSDQASLSRFGSRASHLQPLHPCRPDGLKRLHTHVDGLAADMGGTEMQAALQAVFDLPAPAGADLLLVTDGEIWNIDDTVAAARHSGHRVFAIGVGSAPSAGLLQALADATGGACEFATPGEALEAAAQRMLGRIRQRCWNDIRVDWGCPVQWQTEMPKSLFAGDTVLLCAGLAPAAERPPVRLLARDAEGRVLELARGEAEAPCAGDALPRIAAARRMARARPDAALGLALRYQLMSAQTNCILVHERADADKAAQQAALHIVPSMLAAGWGATSTVRERARAAPMAVAGAPVLWGADDAGFREVRPVMFGGRPRPASPPFDRAGTWALGLEHLPALAARHLQEGRKPENLPLACQAIELPDPIRQTFAALIAAGHAPHQVWLLLALWVMRQGLVDTAPEGWQRVQQQIDSLSRATVRQGLAAFGRPATSDGGVKPSIGSRIARLTAALRRIGE